eukprot:tig00021795_g23532.t1
MDLSMPVMDGLAASARIRAEVPPDQQPHIIALTANVSEEDRRACLAAGMDGFLRKPLRLEELRAALDAFHAARRPAPGPPPPAPSPPPAPAAPDPLPRRLPSATSSPGASQPLCPPRSTLTALPSFSFVILTLCPSASYLY